MSRPEWLTPEMEPFGQSRPGEVGIREELPVWLSYHKENYGTYCKGQVWAPPEWIKCTSHNKSEWNKEQIVNDFSASFPSSHLKNWSGPLSVFIRDLQSKGLEWDGEHLESFLQQHELAPAVQLPSDLRFGIQPCWKPYEHDGTRGIDGKVLPWRLDYVPVSKFEKGPPRGSFGLGQCEPAMQWYGDTITALVSSDQRGNVVNAYVVEIWFEVLQTFGDKGRLTGTKTVDAKPAALGDLQVWVTSIPGLEKPLMVMLLTKPDVDLTYVGTVSVWSHGAETELMMLSPAARLDMSWDRVPRMVTAAAELGVVFPAYRKPLRDPYNR